MGDTAVNKIRIYNIMSGNDTNQSRIKKQKMMNMGQLRLSGQGRLLSVIFREIPERRKEESHMSSCRKSFPHRGTATAKAWVGCVLSTWGNCKVTNVVEAQGAIKSGRRRCWEWCGQTVLCFLGQRSSFRFYFKYDRKGVNVWIRRHHEDHRGCCLRNRMKAVSMKAWGPTGRYWSHPAEKCWWFGLEREKWGQLQFQTNWKWSPWDLWKS